MIAHFKLLRKTGPRRWSVLPFHPALTHLSHDEVHFSLVLDLHRLAVDGDPLLDLQIDRLNEVSAVDEDRAISVFDLLSGQLTLRHAVLDQLVLEVLQVRLFLDEDRDGVLAIDFPDVTIPEHVKVRFQKLSSILVTVLFRLTNQTSRRF